MAFLQNGSKNDMLAKVSAQFTIIKKGKATAQAAASIERSYFTNNTCQYYILQIYLLQERF